jgi:Ni,Fe-hydrogenase III small subunit/ferredoxin
VTIWVLRGLRDGVVTTRWPGRPDEYADSWRGPAAVQNSPPPDGPRAEPGRTPADHADPLDDPGPAALCPTGAIMADRDQLRVDQGKCILCGRCVASRPDLFTWSRGATGPRAAVPHRRALVVPGSPETDAAIEEARVVLARRVRALRRSLHVRHVDAGSDGSEEWEIQALLGPVYDISRLGVFFTASPRHADVLLVTGAGVSGMAQSLRTTYDGMPDPKVVIAAGTDAISGGIVSPGNGAGAVVPIDVWVPGSPPSPFGLLKGLLVAAGQLGGDPGGRP